MFSHLLVGYDGSESARRAYQLAVALARAGHGQVHVVSVLQVSEGGNDACALLMADADTGRLDELRRELTALTPADMDRVQVEVLHGSPGDVLLEKIGQHAIDHIVLGHTERGALARWLIGSVSKDMLARARVPVTVVP